MMTIRDTIFQDDSCDTVLGKPFGDILAFVINSQKSITASRGNHDGNTGVFGGIRRINE